MFLCFAKFISIPCTKNYHHYYLQANYLYEFLKVQWLHFTDVVDKVISAHFQFFQDSIYQKIVKIGSFLTELLKIKMLSIAL